MEEIKRDDKEYLSDLAEIKKMIHQSEDSGIVEVWVYWAFGLLITAGSLISYFLITIKNYTTLNVFLMVWLPALFISALSETVGWIRNMNKKSIPLLSSRFVKFGSSFTGLMIIISILGFYLIQSEIPHPGIYMLLGAIPVFLYSQLTFSSIVIEAWILTGVGILLLINNVSSAQGSLLSGIVIGIVYIILGFHVRHEERKANG